METNTLSLSLQCATAGFTAVGLLFSYLNNRLGRENKVKIADTQVQIQAVHELANGTTTRLTDALSTEQAKNAVLQDTITKAIPKRSTDIK